MGFDGGWFSFFVVVGLMSVGVVGFVTDVVGWGGVGLSCWL